MTQIEFEVPQLPPTEYSPNSRCHWAQRHKAGKVYYDAVYYCALEAKQHLVDVWPIVNARLDLEFVFPHRRVRDLDNITAQFKPGLDALVGAGLIEADDAEHLTIGNIKLDMHHSDTKTIIKLSSLEEKGE